LSVGEALGVDIGGLSFSNRTAIGSATSQATGQGAGIAAKMSKLWMYRRFRGDSGVWCTNGWF
jgi:hypothetical protein